MESNEKESISQEQYDALFGKLANVEELFKEQVPAASQEDFDKATAEIAELKETVEKLGPEIQKMAEAEKPEVVEKSTVDELTKKLEDVQKQVETIEGMPMMKGMQDTPGGEPEKYDVMKGVFRTAFPEAKGE